MVSRMCSKIFRNTIEIEEEEEEWKERRKTINNLRLDYRVSRMLH